MQIIDESTEQIRESLKNAVGAFVWDNDKDNINLVAMEIGSACHDLIDIGNALFGDELITHNGTWARDKNGFFYEDDFSSKVAGVIVTKRKAHLPICEYEKYLFVNERFKEQLDQIKLILSFDRIYNYYDYIGGE